MPFNKRPVNSDNEYSRTTAPSASLFKILTLSGLDNALVLGFSEPQSTLFTNVLFFFNIVGEA